MTKVGVGVSRAFQSRWEQEPLTSEFNLQCSEGGGRIRSASWLSTNEGVSRVEKLGNAECMTFTKFPANGGESRAIWVMILLYSIDHNGGGWEHDESSLNCRMSAAMANWEAREGVKVVTGSSDWKPSARVTSL